MFQRVWLTYMSTCTCMVGHESLKHIWIVESEEPAGSSATNITDKETNINCKLGWSDRLQCPQLSFLQSLTNGYLT